MTEDQGRSRRVSILSNLWLWCTLAALAAGAAGAAVAVIANFNPVPPWLTPVLLGSAGVLGAIAAGLLAWIVRGGIIAAWDNHQALRDTQDRLGRLENIQQSQAQALQKLSELTQMSEPARRLLFRERETAAMTEAFHDFLVRQEYQQAEAFIAELERTLGKSDLTAGIRRELDGARSSTIEQKIDQAFERVRQVVEDHDWPQAMRLARQVGLVYPENARVKALPQLIGQARTRHKSRLLNDYGQAVKVGDVDRSIELLRELDSYLSPQEAAALQESARGVFKARLHNLGVQFAIRATEQQWDEAVAIGQQIVREYPDTRMAQEVRQKMDSLLVLASDTETKK